MSLDIRYRSTAESGLNSDRNRGTYSAVVQTESSSLADGRCGSQGRICADVAIETMRFGVEARNVRFPQCASGRFAGSRHPEARFPQTVWESGTQNRMPKNVWVSVRRGALIGGLTQRSRNARDFGIGEPDDEGAVWVAEFNARTNGKVVRSTYHGGGAGCSLQRRMSDPATGLSHF
jgi:hypothetical protein